MNIKNQVRIGSIIIAFLSLYQWASAASFQNGDFELGIMVEPPINPNDYALYPGNTALTGWTIGGNSIDVMTNGVWQTSSGQRMIDLSGFDAGSISQTFDTVVNGMYHIVFALSGNPAGGYIRHLQVEMLDALTSTILFNQTYDFNTAGISYSNMGWTDVGFNVVTPSNSTTLAFYSLDADPGGPALDNIRISNEVSSVSEPSTLYLIMAPFLLNVVRRIHNAVSRNSGIPRIAPNGKKEQNS